MRLTAKGRYAITAMLDIALHEREGAIVPLADIAMRQDISQSYLEQLFACLRRQRLVRSIRGPGGGYRLDRDADCITLAEVILAVKEPLDSTRCGGKKNCLGNQPCLTHTLWAELNGWITDFLRNMTLADLARKQAVRQVARRQDQVAAAPRAQGAVSRGMAG